MSLTDFRAIVTDKLRETASLVDAVQKDRAIQEALVDYVRHGHPRRRIQTLTGDGAAFTFALASDFEEGLSTLERIEHPVDRQDPEFLDEDDTMLYRDPTTGAVKLRFRNLVLGVGVKAYVHYTARHAVNDSGQDTVPVPDREPIASKAASILFRQLAAYAAQTTQSTIGADSVDRLSQVDRYLALARSLESEYATTFGITSGIAAASAVVDLDVDLAEGWGDRFFHGRRWR